MKSEENLVCLNESELAEASGGTGTWERVPEAWEKYPAPESWECGSKKEGKTVYVPAPCPSCGAQANGRYSMYASYSTEDIFSSLTLYRIVACFACRKEFKEVDSNGNVTRP